MRNSTYLVLTCLGDEVPEQAEQLLPIPPYTSLYLPIPPYTSLYLPIRACLGDEVLEQAEQLLLLVEGDTVRYGEIQ